MNHHYNNTATGLQCARCFRTFAKAEHLTRHERTHTGEKPYPCTACSRRFSRKDVLARHSRSHDGDNPDRPPTKRLWPASGAGAHVEEASSPEMLISEGNQAASPAFDASRLEDRGSRMDPLGFVPIAETIDLTPNEHAQPWASTTTPLREPGLLDTPGFQTEWDFLLGDHLPTLGQPSPVKASDQQPPHQPEAELKTPDFSSTATPCTGSDSLWPRPHYRTARSCNIYGELAAKQPRNLLEDGMLQARCSRDADHVPSLEIDADCRGRLMRDLQGWSTFSRSEPLPDDRSSTPTLHFDEFPSASVLSLGLANYFRRFHALLPFVHEHTLDVHSTESAALLAMCLVGLDFFKEPSLAAFIRAAFQVLVAHCQRELSSKFPSMDARRLLSLEATSIMLISLSVMVPTLWQQHLSETLYITMVDVAQRRGLFRFRHADIPADHRTDDLITQWTMWATLDSAKRVVTCLVMVDAYFAWRLAAEPIIRTELLSIPMPEAMALYEAPESMAWKKRRQKYPSVEPACLSYSTLTSLPRDRDEHSMYAVLSLLWLCEAESKERSKVQDFHAASCITGDLSGQTSLHKVSTILVEFYGRHRQDFMRLNPSCLVFWNTLCMNLVSDNEVFEDAAGRHGQDATCKALGKILQWRRTPAARRCCLHAAQNYFIMARRKIADGMMFQSEAALFTSALALGLFFRQEESTIDLEDSANSVSHAVSYELLQEVDWGELGTMGLPEHQPPDEAQVQLQPGSASYFVVLGGSVTFAGRLLKPGHVATRTVLLAFIDLIAQAGRWDYVESCQILRAMCELPIRALPR